MQKSLVSLKIDNSAVKKILSGNIWLMKNDIIGRKPNAPTIANLIDKRAKFIATAFLSPDSKYFLRIISKSKIHPDINYWQQLIEKAYQRRESLFKTTNAFRIINSESDYMPSIIIDKYNDIFSIQINSSGAETIKMDLIEAVKQLFKPTSIILKNNSNIRKKEGLNTEDDVVYGNKTTTIIFENDQQFEVNVLTGQKTGAYLDYRKFRLKAKDFAKGCCLDGFCYHGWLSCHTAKKAERVIAVDSSNSAINIANKNAELNNHKNIEFVESDVLKYLQKTDLNFDFIHLDPPSFAKGASSLKPALMGYEKLVTESLKRLNPDGIFFISSCSHAITERILEKTVMNSINKTNRKFKIIYRGIQDIDHPLLKGHSESLYLKAVAFEFNN